MEEDGGGRLLLLVALNNGPNYAMNILTNRNARGSVHTARGRKGARGPGARPGTAVGGGIARRLPAN